MGENSRILVQVLVGDTVENMFSDVETSAKTWQSYRKLLTKSNFKELKDTLLSFITLDNKWLQTKKKNYQQTIFLAIHKNEQLTFIEDKNNNSFLKTIYLNLQRSFLLNHRVFKKRNFSCDEKETLLVTASKHHSPAAGATQGYDCLLASVMHNPPYDENVIKFSS